LPRAVPGAAGRGRRGVRRTGRLARAARGPLEPLRPGPCGGGLLRHGRGEHRRLPRQDADGRPLGDPRRVGDRPRGGRSRRVDHHRGPRHRSDPLPPDVVPRAGRQAAVTPDARNAVTPGPGAPPDPPGEATTGIEPQVRIAAVPLFVLIGALAGSIGLLATGAAAPTVLADSGPLGRWGLPAAEFVFN